MYIESTFLYSNSTSTTLVSLAASISFSTKQQCHWFPTSMSHGARIMKVTKSMSMLQQFAWKGMMMMMVLMTMLLQHKI
ncbi:hypothetical protein Lalb_Chr15g0088241 [Lupinus albus]|uniref:Uncharacterized protein n=1 Tax=Lupinus albus TaxID=3870 RepID=A0A6A4PEV9_LUPAL|nr:hypothetical protein Lalb_Chr15g0088241 [Lupinus albus]